MGKELWVPTNCKQDRNIKHLPYIYYKLHQRWLSLAIERMGKERKAMLQYHLNGTYGSTVSSLSRLFGSKYCGGLG